MWAPAGVARCRRSLRPAACRGLCWVPGPSPSRTSSPHLAWASAPGCGSAGGLRARAVGASYAPASERHLLSLLLTPRSSPLCDGAPSGQKQTNAPPLLTARRDLISDALRVCSGCEPQQAGSQRWACWGSCRPGWASGVCAPKTRPAEPWRQLRRRPELGRGPRCARVPQRG